MVRDLTRGSLSKALFRLSLPIIGANILQVFYNLVDTFWVGRLGAEQVAAVSLSFPIIFLLVSLGIGLNTAGVALVSQFKGRRSQRMVDKVAGQTIITGLTVSLIIGFLGFIMAPYLISLMGAEAAVMNDAIVYLRIIFVGLFTSFVYFAFQALMRGVGDSKTPFYIVLGSILLNLVLDPLFIFTFSLGVGGAALATVLSQLIAAVAGVLLLASGKFHIHIKLHDLVPDRKIIKRIFEIGLPASVDQSVRSLGMAVMMFIVARFGTDTIAAYGIGARILSFIVIPSFGFSMANSAIVGQNIGADKMKRAEEVSLFGAKFTFVLFTFLGVLTFLFSGGIASIFVPGNEVVIAQTSSFLKIVSLSFGFIAVQLIFNGTFKGSGSTKIAMMISLFVLWMVRIPLALFLSSDGLLSFKGIFWAFPVSNVAAAMMASFFFFKGSWKEKRIVEDI